MMGDNGRRAWLTEEDQDSEGGGEAIQCSTEEQALQARKLIPPAYWYVR